MSSVYNAIKEAYADRDLVVAEAAAKKLMREFADAKLLVQDFRTSAGWSPQFRSHDYCEKSRIVFVVDGVKVTIEDERRA